MFIYNVTVHVEPSVEASWLDWMREEHIPAVLNTGKFTHAKLFKVITDQDQGGVSYATQYHCTSAKEYEQYLVENADELRQDAQDRFGSSILAFRTQLEEILSL
jgi:hypothetical protein